MKFGSSLWAHRSLISAARALSLSADPQSSHVWRLSVLGRFAATAAVAALLLACQGFGTRTPTSAVEVTATPSWETPVAEVFAIYCNECHGPVASQGAPSYLRTDIYDNAGNVQGVTSLFDRHLARAQDGSRPMPPPPNQMMTSDELAMLRTWAANGFPRTVAEAGSGAPIAGACTPDQLVPCACVQGYWGWQYCEAGGMLSECICDSPIGERPDAGAADAFVADVSFDVAQDAPLGGADSGAAPTLAALFENVFQPSCSESTCHGTGAGSAPPQLDTLTGLQGRLLGASTQARGMAYVVPGNPAGSYLYLKTRADFGNLGVGFGEVMPTEGRTMAAGGSDQILAWILGGAQP